MRFYLSTEHSIPFFLQREHKFLLSRFVAQSQRESPSLNENAPLRRQNIDYP